jgi:DNA-binding CsgD family transcriptional regulator
LLELATEALGIEQAVFVSFIREDDSRENFRILLAGEAMWCLAYQEKHWFADDAWLLYAAMHSEPVADSAIKRHTKSQREARALASQFGTVSAYVVPAPSGVGLTRVGVLVLGSSQTNYFDGPAVGSLKVLARSLAMELHEWWVRQIRDEIIETKGIAAEDLRLLALERQGLGTKQIMSALGVSAASVDSRFQRLNAKFNMPSRRATARLAAEHGLI